MKMKGKLDSPKPMKKHKLKVKKNSAKKKKQVKTKAKQSSKTREKKAPLVVEVDNSSLLASSAVSQNESLPLAEVATIDERGNFENHLVDDTSADQTPLSKTAAPASQSSTHRVSKNVISMDKAEQQIGINRVVKRLLMDEITQGEALRELRVKVLGLRQQDYVALAGVSRKTVSEIENDKGNYTADILNKVFKPFDLTVALVPMSRALLVEIMANK